MRKYFTAFPAKWPPFSYIFKSGIALLITGALILFFLQNTLITGTFLILSSGGLFYYWLIPYLRDKKNFESRPTLNDMHQWLINDLHTKIKERATEVLRLNVNSLKSENFLIVHYPIYWEEAGIKPDNILKRATGEKIQKSKTEFESLFLYSIIKVQIIALTKNYISYYACNYDWLNDSILGEHTNEFFYADITSVKNDFEVINRKLKESEEVKALNALVFKVTNMSSDNLTVITKIPALNYSSNLEVSLEKAIQALRIIIRKRRYDEDQEPKIIKPETNEENSGFDQK